MNSLRVGAIAGFLVAVLLLEVFILAITCVSKCASVQCLKRYVPSISSETLETNGRERISLTALLSARVFILGSPQDDAK
jgi:hypothetical protein